MQIINLISSACVVAYHSFYLASPVALDVAGCDRVTLRSNYYEIGRDKGKPDKWSWNFIDSSGKHQAVIDDVTYNKNFIHVLHQDGTEYAGYSKGGCAHGFKMSVTDDEHQNHFATCKK